jgi:hypothetical protein
MAQDSWELDTPPILGQLRCHIFRLWAYVLDKEDDSLICDKYHIFKDFVSLTDKDITNVAEACWAAEPNTNLKMNDTLLEQFYSSCVLLKIVHNSTSVELRKEIYHKVPTNMSQQ